MTIRSNYEGSGRKAHSRVTHTPRSTNRRAQWKKKKKTDLFCVINTKGSGFCVR